MKIYKTKRINKSDGTGSIVNKFKIINIDTRLGDGLSPIKEGEADTIIIAGMGGDVISHIISDCSFIKNPDITLLLQPMTSAEVLRSFLFENCFEIVSETPVTDQGKVYTVISARYSGKANTYPAGAEYTGLITAKSEEGRMYLLKQHKRISSCINDISTLPQKTTEREYLIKVKEHINKLLEIY